MCTVNCELLSWERKSKYNNDIMLVNNKRGFVNLIPIESEVNKSPYELMFHYTCVRTYSEV